MSNFDFLQPFYPTIFDKMKIAESRVFTEPKSAALYTRLALEEAVHLIFEEEQLEFPYDTNLANLLVSIRSTTPPFTAGAIFPDPEWRFH